MVARALRVVRPAGGTLLDVGCGVGRFWPTARAQFDRYIGCDVIRYEGFPADAEFVQAELNTNQVPLPSGFADVVTAVETIEHLENPRAFARELVRLVKPGGWVVITTPNNLSILSKLTLVVKNQFNAFQDSSYPAHITALLERDLKRIAAECGLVDLRTAFSLRGRLPGTAWHFPRWACRCLPRALSDNILIMGHRPAKRLP
jgi:2-polyprenyl-3-methyl-5-hydroxy-6-metoxy-1,4-benzoquinol methylase